MTASYNKWYAPKDITAQQPLNRIVRVDTRRIEAYDGILAGRVQTFLCSISKTIADILCVEWQNIIEDKKF